MHEIGLHKQRCMGYRDGETWGKPSITANTRSSQTGSSKKARVRRNALFFSLPVSASPTYLQPPTDDLTLCTPAHAAPSQIPVCPTTTPLPPTLLYSRARPIDRATVTHASWGRGRATLPRGYQAMAVGRLVGTGCVDRLPA